MKDLPEADECPLTCFIDLIFSQIHINSLFTSIFAPPPFLPKSALSVFFIENGSNLRYALVYRKYPWWDLSGCPDRLPW